MATIHPAGKGPSEGAGSVSAASITDATAIGVALLLAADATTARRVIGALASVASSDLADATDTGKALIKAASAAAARQAIGAIASVAAGDITDATDVGKSIMKAADAAAARKVLGSPYVLAQSGELVVCLPSATAISETGAITGLTTTVPYTPPGVVKVYCYAQAGLSAGLYYAKFSSTANLQLYTDAACTTTPVGITAGAYAGGTGAAIMASVTIPAGLMGANGALRITFVGACAGNTNSKTVRPQVAANTIVSALAVSSASYSGYVFAGTWRNQNNPAYQVGTSNSYGGDTSRTRTSIDTTGAQTLTFVFSRGSVSDFMTLEGYTVEVLPGA